jgi:hypothetical protein
LTMTDSFWKRPPDRIRQPGDEDGSSVGKDDAAGLDAAAIREKMRSSRPATILS